MDIETIYYLSIALDVIVLICFFVLVGNVSEIKKALNASSKPQLALFTFYLSTGDKAKAREILKGIILSDQVFETAFYSNIESKKYARELVINKYQALAKEVDFEIDFAKVEEVFNLIKPLQGNNN